MSLITEYDPMSLEFGVIYEDQYAGRHPEDGAELLAQVVFVTATANDGTRWKRYVGTYGWVTECDEDDFHVYRAAFSDCRKVGDTLEMLLDAAAKAVANIERSTTRRLNPDVWEDWIPVYGSKEYSRRLYDYEREAEEQF
jgi:hypothetical protein